MPAGEAGPAHCKVTGIIETEINFELLLPEAWNGHFMMGGGGGFVGSVQNSALNYGAGDGALHRGYATVGTDTGHVGGGIEASWAFNNPERQENFGHRAVHLTAEAAKSIVGHFYDQVPEYSYLVGCSRVGELESLPLLRIGTLDGSAPEDSAADEEPAQSRKYELWLTRAGADWVLEASEVSSDETAARPDVVGRIRLSREPAAEAFGTFSAAVVLTSDDAGQLVLGWGDHKWTADFQFADPPEDEEGDEEEETVEEHDGPCSRHSDI